MKKATEQRVENIIEELGSEDDLHPISFWQKKAEENQCAEMFADYLHFLTSFRKQVINAGEKSVRLKPFTGKKEWSVACYPNNSSSEKLQIGLRKENVEEWNWPNEQPIKTQENVCFFDVTPSKLQPFLAQLKIRLETQE